MQQVDFFIMERSDNLTHVLEFLARAGVDQTFIEYKVGGICIKLNGTLLKCMRETRGDWIFYTLKYHDIILCETTDVSQNTPIPHNAFWYYQGDDDSDSEESYPQSQFKTVYGLPSCLLEQPRPTVFMQPMFYVSQYPTELQMKHLAYVGISLKNLTFIRGSYYFILEDSQAFYTYTNYVDGRTVHYLQCKGIEIAQSYHIKGNPLNSVFEVDFLAISAVINSVQNVLAHPISIARTAAFKAAAHGTIEACVAGIRTNSYDAFRLLDSKLFAKFNFVPFSDTNKSTLFSALKNNSSLKELELCGLLLSKDDLIELIHIFAKHPAQPRLYLSGCKLHISRTQLTQLLPVLCSLGTLIAQTYTTEYDHVDRMMEIYRKDRKSDIKPNVLNVLLQSPVYTTSTFIQREIHTSLPPGQVSGIRFAPS